MSKRDIQIATVVFLIISVVLVWQAINFYPEIGITQEKIKSQEISNRDLENSAKKLSELVAFASKNKEIISRFDSILPFDEKKADLLSSLDSLASANGLIALKIIFVENNEISNAQQDAAKVALKNNDFSSKNIKMSLRGSYGAFKSFLAAVEKNLRVMDIVSINFLNNSFEEKAGERNMYTYNIEIKTYLHKPSGKENIAGFLSTEKFKKFTIKDLNFTEEKMFNELSPFFENNINIGADEIGNQSIF